MDRERRRIIGFEWRLKSAIMNALRGVMVSNRRLATGFFEPKRKGIGAKLRRPIRRACSLCLRLSLERASKDLVLSSLLPRRVSPSLLSSR